MNFSEKLKIVLFIQTLLIGKNYIFITYLKNITINHNQLLTVFQINTMRLYFNSFYLQVDIYFFSLVIFYFYFDQYFCHHTKVEVTMDRHSYNFKMYVRQKYNTYEIFITIDMEKKKASITFLDSERNLKSSKGN